MAPGRPRAPSALGETETDISPKLRSTCGDIWKCLRTSGPHAETSRDITETVRACVLLRLVAASCRADAVPDRPSGEAPEDSDSVASQVPSLGLPPPSESGLGSGLNSNLHDSVTSAGVPAEDSDDSEADLEVEADGRLGGLGGLGGGGATTWRSNNFVANATKLLQVPLPGFG